MIKIVATRCQSLRLKCTKFNFGWGSAPDPAEGAYSAPPDSLAGLRGSTSKGRGEDGNGREERKGKGGVGKGRGSLGEERGGDETPSLHAPPNPCFWIRPWLRVATVLNYLFRWYFAASAAVFCRCSLFKDIEHTLSLKSFLN